MAAVGQGSLGPNTNTDTGAHTNTLDDTHTNIVKGTQESFSDLGEIRVWLRADFQSGSRVLKKVF